MAIVNFVFRLVVAGAAICKIYSGKEDELRRNMLNSIPVSGTCKHSLHSYVSKT